MFTLYTCHGGVMGRRVYKTLSAIKRAIAIARDNRTYDSVSDGYTLFNGAVQQVCLNFIRSIQNEKMVQRYFFWESYYNYRIDSCIVRICRMSCCELSKVDVATIPESNVIIIVEDK